MFLAPNNVAPSQVYQQLAGDSERIFLVDSMYQSSLHTFKKEERQRKWDKIVLGIMYLRKQPFLFLSLFFFSQLMVH